MKRKKHSRGGAKRAAQVITLIVEVVTLLKAIVELAKELIKLCQK